MKATNVSTNSQKDKKSEFQKKLLHITFYKFRTVASG